VHDYVNQGKTMRDVPEGADQHNVVANYLQEADVVIECPESSEPRIHWRGDMCGSHPVVTTITPFGECAPTGVRPGRSATELFVSALSGLASVNGRPGRAPLKASGSQASYLTGAAACSATLAALFHRFRTGKGRHIKVDALSSVVSVMAPSILASQYIGVPPGPRPGGFPAGPMKTRDGEIVLTVSRAHFWRDAMNALGLPELADQQPGYDPSYKQAKYAEVAPLVGERVAEFGRDELFDLLASLRLTVGKVMDVGDLFEDEHLRERCSLGGTSVEALFHEGLSGLPFRLFAHRDAD
jgi:crotonobetainyl-CoA:carnitine CoA-transferase CaiB-like acyl-CoA transferase